VARAGRGGERRMRRASDVRVFHGRLLSVLAQAAHHIPRRPSSLQPVTRVSTCVCRAKELWGGGGGGERKREEGGERGRERFRVVYCYKCSDSFPHHTRPT
jgi:hypothetical protein